MGWLARKTFTPAGRANRSDDTLQMRFFNMPADPHDDTVNVDFDDGVGVRCDALRINCRC